MKAVVHMLKTIGKATIQTQGKLKVDCSQIKSYLLLTEASSAIYEVVTQTYLDNDSWMFALRFP